MAPVDRPGGAEISKTDIEQWHSPPHVLLTFAENFPFSWLVEDFAFFWFAPDQRLNDRSWTDELLGGVWILLRQAFNSRAVYEGRRLTWDTLILRKCQELARYLLGKAASFELTSPRPVLERSDTRELRQKILRLSQSEARKRGIGKGTLHHLRRKAESHLPFKVYSKVQKRLR